MRVSLIVAVGKRGQIGLDNRLLWKIGDDLKNFKKLTSGHCVIMGRKTFESIGKPLPNRKNLILSNNPVNITEENMRVFSRMELALEHAERMREEEVFICGGESVYKYALEHNLVDKMYISFVNYDGDADRYFSAVDYSKWRLLEEKTFPKNDVNEYSFVFKVFERN